MSLNISQSSTMQPPNSDSLTLLDAGGPGGSSFTLIHEFLGDSKLSLACKGLWKVGDIAMANLTYSLLNNGLCLELRLLRNIREVDSFVSPRAYTSKVKQVLESGLSEQERLAVKSLFWGKVIVERGGE